MSKLYDGQSTEITSDKESGVGTAHHSKNFMALLTNKYDKLDTEGKVNLMRSVMRNPVLALADFIGGEGTAVDLLHLTPEVFAKSIRSELVDTYPELALFGDKLNEVEKYIANLVKPAVEGFTDVVGEVLFDREGNPIDFLTIKDRHGVPE